MPASWPHGGTTWDAPMWPAAVTLGHHRSLWETIRSHSPRTRANQCRWAKLQFQLASWFSPSKLPIKVILKKILCIHLLCIHLLCIHLLCIHLLCIHLLCIHSLLDTDTAIIIVLLQGNAAFSIKRYHYDLRSTPRYDLRSQSKNPFHQNSS